MDDLYGTSIPSSTPHDPEDISSFLHHLLHNPSSSSCIPTSSKQMHSQPPSLLSVPPESTSVAGVSIPVEDRFSLARSAIRSGFECGVKRGRGIDSSSEINFSDPGVYFPVDRKEGTDDVFSSMGVVDSDANMSPSRRRGFSGENDFGDFSCDSEVAMNAVSQRTSSKRTRAAEVHNLSEKRRRSKINEKMKALQNLIPNSNKTDKASMLDEAIEYLKQLQLQVQMLSMRNGVSLHPMYLPGVLQPVLLPEMGIHLDEGNGLQNNNREAGTYSEIHGTTMQTAFDLSCQSSPSNHQNIIPSMTNTRNLETPFGYEQSIENHYGHFNLTTSSKEICRDDTLPQVQLDISGSCKNSSSGVS